MKLYRTILEVRFPEPASKFKFPAQLFEAIVGKQPQSKLMSNGISVRIDDERSVVNVEHSRVIIRIESNDKQRSIDFLVTVFDRVNNLLEMKKATSVIVDNLYIKPTKSNFKTLAQSFKDKYLKDTPLVSAAYDYGIPLKIKLGNFDINVAMGPMEKSQLMDYFEFEFNDHNKVYSIINFTSVVKKVKTTKRDMVVVLTDAFAKHEEIMEAL